MRLSVHAWSCVWVCPLGEDMCTGRPPGDSMLTVQMEAQGCAVGRQAFLQAGRQPCAGSVWEHSCARTGQDWLLLSSRRPCLRV